MKLFVRILRRAAALLNGIFVLTLLATLTLSLGLLVLGGWQRTAQPVVFGYAVAVAEADAPALALQQGDLVLIKPENTVRIRDLVCYRKEGEIRFGCVLLEGPLSCSIGNEAGTRVQDTGVAYGQLLGTVQVRIPRLGGWLQASQTLPGLAWMIGVGVLLVELPAFLQPRKKEDSPVQRPLCS